MDLTDHHRHMLIDCSAYNFLTRISRRLHELLRVEHLIDLLGVGDLSAVGEALFCARLSVLLPVVHRCHLLLCLQVGSCGGMWHLVWSRMHRHLRLLTRCLGLMTLAMHPPLLIAVGVSAITTSHLTIASTVVQRLAGLHATHRVSSLSLLVVLAVVSTNCGHGRYPALLATNLQLVHEQSERGDELDEVSVFGTHDVHLVFLIRFLVNLLLEVKATSFLRLDERHEQVPTFEEDLRCCLLCGASRLSVGEADEGHGRFAHQLYVVDVAELEEELSQLLFSR